MTAIAASPVLFESPPVPAVDLLNAQSALVLQLDRTGLVRFANLACETIMNASQEQIIGKSLGDYLPADSPLLALIRECQFREGVYSEYAVDLSFLAGQRLVADIQVLPLLDHPDALLVMVQSRAIAKMIDRQLTHQGAARSVVGVAAMLAHEIRNPLSGIRGAAQLLESGADADGRELTQLICTEVDRIRALVDRMDTFTDTRPLDRRPENIHQILSHVRQVIASGIGASVPIRERYDPSLPYVFGNRDKLVQVFLNLAKNAVEAVEHVEAPEIILTTAYRHGVRVTAQGSSRRISLPIEVCVIDNGAGPPADISHHLYEPFVTSKPNGSGLGLALAAKLIGDHGGVIEHGRLTDPPRTMFRVLLPNE
jgi:two-component system, NtrC family, nitrogen regulation sensor histidine kinase GlnL